MMTLESALNKIQQTIDKPQIDKVKKRQLFALYQTLKTAKVVSAELEQAITSLCKE